MLEFGLLSGKPFLVQDWKESWFCYSVVAVTKQGDKKRGGGVPGWKVIIRIAKIFWYYSYIWQHYSQQWIYKLWYFNCGAGHTRHGLFPNSQLFFPHFSPWDSLYSATLAFFLFLEHNKLIPALVSLHVLDIPSAWNIVPRGLLHLGPSHHSGLNFDVTFPGRPFLIAPSKTFSPIILFYILMEIITILNSNLMLIFSLPHLNMFRIFLSLFCSSKQCAPVWVYYCLKIPYL